MALLDRLRNWAVTTLSDVNTRNGLEQILRELLASVSEYLDALGSTRGSLLYRGSAGWTTLPPGTSSHVLTSNGAGADPSWQAASGGGGGGSSNAGNEIIDFATDPGHYAQIVVTGQTWVTTSSHVTATVLAKASTQYSIYEHQVIAGQCGLSVGDYVAGTGFTITCFSNVYLDGELNVQWMGA